MPGYFASVRVCTLQVQVRKYEYLWCKYFVSKLYVHYKYAGTSKYTLSSSSYSVSSSRYSVSTSKYTLSTSR